MSEGGFFRFKKKYSRCACGDSLMSSPLALTSDAIDGQIKANVCGNYRLSRNSLESGFVVDYIGRSDTCLASRLKDHIPEGYKSFVYSTNVTPEDCYCQECRDYHDYGGDIGLLDNDPTADGHPRSPKGMQLKCPVCG